MSKIRTDRKPPLAKSPIRARPRRVLRSNSSSLQTPPGSLTKSQKLIRSWDVEEPDDLRPEYHSISCELRALAKMVQDEFGEIDADNKAGFGTSKSANSSPLFERGRFYEEYAARRNERLKRKKSETGNGEKTPYNLGVTVESAKRRDSKKIQNLRKSVSAAYSVERSEPRYMLRSMSKENKKPPLPLNSERSVIGTTERKTAARRTRKLI
ncbi:FACT complex subunit like [Melia azedarach]|uniref:FACT complex subunit like n=1 Tax=Melia azedarach TaxID=155640 RepID=A0ACC1WTJ6_MELAZ|nr:FACT complex subunit like [Melia azedarach]